MNLRLCHVEDGRLLDVTSEATRTTVTYEYIRVYTIRDIPVCTPVSKI